MHKVSKLSISFSVAVFLLSLYFFLPNVVNLPKYLSFSNSKINFGLDINGGTHLLMKVNTEAYL